MRTITVSVNATSQTAAVSAFKVIRKAIPDSDMGSTLSSLRTNGELFSIETDCPEWNERLNLLIALADDLDQFGLPYRMKMVERFPRPISSVESMGNNLGHLNLHEVFGDPHQTAKLIHNTEARLISRRELQEILDFERHIRVRALPASVISLLDRLRNANWFSRVGIEVDDRTVTQGSIEEANREQQVFEDVSLEFQNMLSASLCYNFHYHYNRCWNVVVRLLRPQLDDLFEHKLRQQSVLISDYLAASLRCTILDACVETFFSTQVPPSVKTSWIEWIARGHIPYGWEGDFASGRLVVV